VPRTEIKIGLVAMHGAPKKVLNISFAPKIFARYQTFIRSLVKQGAELVILPEETFSVNKDMP